MHKSLFSIALVGAAVTSQASLYTFDWTPASGGAVNNAVGSINSIHSTFDNVSDQLTWYANLGSKSVKPTANAFTLVLSDGPNPKGKAGQLAILYFDGINKQLTAYGYNGRNDASSYLHGKSDGTGQPDSILSSLVNPGLVKITEKKNADGSETLGFTLDAKKIQSHKPKYPETSPWQGTGYGNKVGVWFHPMVATSCYYKNGFLSQWNIKNQGWLDGENFMNNPVPEPTSMALLAMGGAAVLRRRSKKNA